MRNGTHFGYLRTARLALIAATLGVITSPLFAQRLIWLGTLGGSSSVAKDVSADGTVVVGTSRDVNDRSRAFRWTALDGMQNLGTLSNYNYSSDASGVSADGSVVVGSSMGFGGQLRAFRWTELGGMQDLGTLQGASWSSANDVSADGSVVVGNSGGRGFRWTEAGGMQPIDGHLESSVYAVSADGSVAVGSVPGYNYRLFAYRWSADGTWQNLTIWSIERATAFGVSPNGALVVGWGAQANDGWRRRAWVWGGVGGVQLPSQSQAVAYAISRNDVVVGESANRATRWVYCNGRYVEQDLNSVYFNVLNPGSSLNAAYAISPDGRYIVGSGYNGATRRTEGYLLDTCGNNGDVEEDGCVDDADLLSVLFAFGGNSTICEPKREDVNCDGIIDDADLLIVLFNFGSGC